MRVRASIAFATLAVTAIALAAVFGGANNSAVAEGTSGHCNFSLKNQWVGPLKACMSPSTPSDCEATGKKDENSGAQFAEGACPTAALVGVCKTDKGALSYYEGEAAGLEMGCGFQQGEWTTAAK
jgi:hypothetical protein